MLLLLLLLWKIRFVLFFFLFPSAHTHACARAHTHIYIHLTFLQISFMSLNSNFYDFRVKFSISWRLFIPNFTRAISKITRLLAGTFSFVKFTSIKILFAYLCLFIYFYLLTPVHNILFQILEFIIIFII
jgi:hypothetical protein